MLLPPPLLLPVSTISMRPKVRSRSRPATESAAAGEQAQFQRTREKLRAQLRSGKWIVDWWNWKFVKELSSD